MRTLSYLFGYFKNLHIPRQKAHYILILRFREKKQSKMDENKRKRSLEILLIFVDIF